MARKRIQEEPENLERWLVSYADFITLMFAFFVLMYAISQTDKLNQQEALLSIQRAFLSGGGIFPLKGFPFTPFDAPPDRGSHVPPKQGELGNYTKATGSHEDGSESLERLKKQLKGVFEQTAGFNPKPSDIEVLPSKEGFKIRLGETVLFKPGSAKLQVQHLPFLYEIGKRLKNFHLPIQIEGHTDSTQSTKDSNWKLSLERASNIVTFLVTGTEYPKNMVSLAGYGDTEPIADNDSDEGRAKNRRVEIVVLTKGKRLSELPW